MSDYWDFNQIIPATEQEKESILKYEIEMFLETCRQFSNFNFKNKFDKNLLIESLALHIRVLVEFFYNKKREDYPNDLVAQDLLPNNVNWGERRPVITNTLEEAKNKADKLLAHLSLWRLKLERDGKKSWGNYSDIERDIKSVITIFGGAIGRNFLS